MTRVWISGLMMCGLLACDGRTRLITEGEQTLFSEHLEGDGRFESGDPLLQGSAFCIERNTEAQNGCVRMNGAAAEEELGFCFEFPELGVVEVEIEPEPCEVDSGGFFEADLLRLDVLPPEGLEAVLYWPVESQAASMLEGGYYEILGPDFAVDGVVPNPQTPLWIWPDASLPVYLSVVDGESDVAWSAPWRIEVEGASLGEDRVWTFDGDSEGGRIAVVDAEGTARIEAREWGPADTSAQIEDRLHLAIFEWESEDFDVAVKAGVMPLPSIHAFLESTGPDGEVVKGRPVSWSIQGVWGALLVQNTDPAAMEVNLMCAQGWRSRQERMVVQATTATGSYEQAFWVRIPRIPSDRNSKAALRATCDREPELSGCSQVPGRALLLPGLLALLGLLLRRKQD